MLKDIKTVSVIGIGNLGKQIAEWSALYGYNVNIYDVNSDGLIDYLKDVSEKLKENDGNGEIRLFNSIAEAVKDADLVIEAVPEKLELKKIVFKEIDKEAPSQAILATNSSSIPVSRIENSVKRKEKLLNLHFYKLPDFPMADIARGTKTSDDTFNKGKDLKKECLGFVFNRVWRAVKKECLKIWDGGYADLEEVDKAWKVFTKMEIGPFEFMDIIGLDVVYDIEMMYYKESGDPDDKPPQILKDKVNKGELGEKTGKGFYDYDAH
ncbi:MAG: 3-hydroxyacyl-CoA dehydrogenase family protein [Promethearchaeota archaeon]